MNQSGNSGVPNGEHIISCYPSLSLVLFLFDVESFFQQIHLLLQMTCLQSRCHTRTGISSSIHHVLPVMMFRLIQQCFYSWLRKAPSTSIKRFFLTPNNVLSIGVHVKVLFELRPWKRVQLLDAGDCGILVLLTCAMLVYSNVDLTCTQDYSLNLFWWSNGLSVFRVRDDPLKVRFTREIFD